MITTETDPALDVRCSARLGDAGEKTLTRPARWGWWWHRIMPWEPWEPRRIMEIAYAKNGLCCPALNMGDEPCLVRWAGDWAGPMTPPASPNDSRSATRRDGRETCVSTPTDHARSVRCSAWLGDVIKTGKAAVLRVRGKDIEEIWVVRTCLDENGYVSYISPSGAVIRLRVLPAESPLYEALGASGELQKIITPQAGEDDSMGLPIQVSEFELQTILRDSGARSVSQNQSPCELSHTPLTYPKYLQVKTVN